MKLDFSEYGSSNVEFLRTKSDELTVREHVWEFLLFHTQLNTRMFWYGILVCERKTSHYKYSEQNDEMQAAWACHNSWAYTVCTAHWS